MKISLILAAALTATAFCIGPATADVIITGSGTFDDTALTTDFTAPAESWSFSFEIPNPIANNPTSDISNESYQLNGVDISETLSSVVFYDSDFDGLFDLAFSDGTIVSLYGSDIGSTLTILPGTYAANISLFGGAPFGDGTVTATPAQSAVPEPTSLALLGAGLVGIGRLRKRKAK